MSRKIAVGCLMVLGLCQTLPAQALPKMPIVDAKETLLFYNDTPVAKEFKKRRLLELPTFDKIGIGNYHVQYRLDQGKKLLIWMYVEYEPPLVDEVVLFVTPAAPADLSYDKALKLLALVYKDSNTGVAAYDDFKAIKPVNRLKYDGELYLLGDSYGYKASVHRGGFELSILRMDRFKPVFNMVKSRLPKPPVKPIPMPTIAPTPKPTPLPRIGF